MKKPRRPRPPSRWAFLAVEPPHPLEPFPTLLRGGRPYNLSLSEDILQPLVEAWTGKGAAVQSARAAVREEFAAAADRARLAFAEILPAASAAGEPAVLAALGVTANLQRTLAILAEWLLDERTARRFRSRKLSRGWCGLVAYPRQAPYFPAPIKRPALVGRTRPGHNDLRHLCNALWCSGGAVAERCEEAMERLQREIRESRLLSGE